jgi:hypothetical protein
MLSGLATRKVQLGKTHGDGVPDFNNSYFVIRVYSDLSMMSLNHLSLLWTSVAIVLCDNISSSVTIVTIW